MEFRAIQFIATNQVQGCPLGHKRRCQAEYVGPVATAGKQGHRDLMIHPDAVKLGNLRLAPYQILSSRSVAQVLLTRALTALTYAGSRPHRAPLTYTLPCRNA